MKEPSALQKSLCLDGSLILSKTVMLLKISVDAKILIPIKELSEHT